MAARKRTKKARSDEPKKRVPKKPQPRNRKPQPKKRVSPKKKPRKASTPKKSTPKKRASQKQKKRTKKTTPKKKKRLTRRIFERRPRRAARDEEIPEGFEPIPGQISIDLAYQTILVRLEEAKARLPEGYEGRVLIHAYADGSVDGELYVKVPEATSTADSEFDLYDAFTPTALGDFFWISTGARYILETDDERYRRFKGMTQVQTNYQRANQANIVEEHAILRSKIITGMDKRFGEEAHSVFIRLHWNAQDEQPKR